MPFETIPSMQGVLIVNNRVLGRYWPVVGPQLTLYLPAPYIRPGTNTIMVLEQVIQVIWDPIKSFRLI